VEVWGRTSTTGRLKKIDGVEQVPPKREWGSKETPAPGGKQKAYQRKREGLYPEAKPLMNKPRNRNQGQE
jgi:hypothetical protein